MKSTLLSQANSAFQSKSYEKALALYQEALNRKPSLSQIIALNLSLSKARIGNGYVKDGVGNKKIIIYTCNFGGYESVKEPLHVDPEVEYILFTDDKTLKSKRWKVVVIDECLDDARRTSRLPKILAHRYLPAHDVSLYLDSSLELKEKNVRSMIENCLEGKELAFYKHYKRNCVYDEIEFVTNSKDRILVNHELSKNQIKKYQEIKYPKNNGLYENAFIVRKNTKKVQLLNELWWKEYSEGAERDQFSLMYSLYKLNIKPNAIKKGEQFRKSPYVNFYKHKYIPSKKNHEKKAKLIKNCNLKHIQLPKNKRSLLVAHIYHQDLFESIAQQIKKLYLFCDVAITVEKKSPLIEKIKKTFPNAMVYEFDNYGQDIIPFLNVVKDIGERYKYICKIHTKKGDKKDADLWREDLYDSVSRSTNLISSIISLFDDNNTLGMIGSTLFYVECKKYIFSNKSAIQDLLSDASYNEVLNNTGFFAGTIFWIRSEVAQKVAQYLPVKIQENVSYKTDGTLAHAFERLFGIVNAKLGYKVGHYSKGYKYDKITIMEQSYHSEFVKNHSSITEQLSSLIKVRKNQDLIIKSQMLNEDYYEIKYSANSIYSPFFEFSYVGLALHKSPNEYFDPKWYLKVNRDLIKRSVNPFLHYIKVGEKEGRYPNPIFNPTVYRDKYMGPEDKGYALSHYLKYGDESLFDPGYKFSAQKQHNAYANKEGYLGKPGLYYLSKEWKHKKPFWDQGIFEFSNEVLDLNP